MHDVFTFVLALHYHMVGITHSLTSDPNSWISNRFLLSTQWEEAGVPSRSSIFDRRGRGNDQPAFFCFSICTPQRPTNFTSLALRIVRPIFTFPVFRVPSVISVACVNENGHPRARSPPALNCHQRQTPSIYSALATKFKIRHHLDGRVVIETFRWSSKPWARHRQLNPNATLTLS